MMLQKHTMCRQALLCSISQHPICSPCGHSRTTTTTLGTRIQSASSSSTSSSSSWPSSLSSSPSSSLSGQCQVQELPGVWRFTHPHTCPPNKHESPSTPTSAAPSFDPSSAPSPPAPGAVSTFGPPDLVPLLIDSPHSGAVYPSSFKPALDLAALQQTADSYVHELWSGAPSAAGCSLLEALFPRCFIDPNRPPDDIDPELLDGPWTLDPPLNPGPKTKLGIGLIRRLASPGKPIYNRRLTPQEVAERIACYHGPYHEKMEQELQRSHSRYGHAFLLDAHSMKSLGNSTTPDGPGAVRPHVVVGDLDGTACAPWLTECVVESLRYKQYTVRVNDPYKGAYILKRHGRPREGRHAVQVEVNRSLYMDEGTRVKQSASFTQLQHDLTYVAVQVAEAIRQRTPASPGLVS